MLWGCFSWHGTGHLALIEGIMTARVYIDILKAYLPESVIKLEIETKFVFQQDNDPKHTAKISKSFFEDNGIKVLDWPPHSPDLNPIEHLWDHLAVKKSTDDSNLSLFFRLL